MRSSGTSARIRSSSRSTTPCASVERQLARQLHVQRQLVAVGQPHHAHVVDLAHLGDRAAAAAVARSRMSALGLASAPRARRRRRRRARAPTTSSMLSATVWAWRTPVSSGTPTTRSTKWRPPAWRTRTRRSSTCSVGLRERRADALVGLGDGAVHEHVDRLLGEPQRRDDHERGDEQRRAASAPCVAGPHEERARQHRQRAGQVGGEVERVRGERRRAVAPRGAEARERPRGVDDDHDDEHGERPPGRVHVVAVRRRSGGRATRTR